MDAVASIEVHGAGLAEHGGVPRCQAAVGVAGGIVLRKIGLDLSETAPADFRAPQDLAD